MANPLYLTDQCDVRYALENARPGSHFRLAPGVYRLESPLTLRGLRGVRIEGGENVVLTGSRAVPVRWEDMGGGIYRAPAALDAAPDGLSIGGRDYIMARYPHAQKDGGYFNGCAPDCLDFAARSAHPEDGYFHAMHSLLWGDIHYRITGPDGKGGVALEGGWQNNRPDGCHETYRFVENIREALGAPGEYFYDAREQALYVCAEEMPGGTAELYVNAYLLRLEDCRDVEITGLRLTGTKRTFMEAYEPLVRSDWCIHRGGAVFMEDVKDISLLACDFDRIGSNAVFVSGDAERVRVKECHFEQIGASCVCFAGRSDALRAPLTVVGEQRPVVEDTEGVGPLNSRYVRDCLVENCLMHDFGLTEKQVAGVEIAMSARITVRNTSIYRCPRAGINIGDGTFGGHLIEGNDVFDTVRESSDHGSFNSWGRDRFWRQSMPDDQLCALAHRDAVETTVIRGNRMRCDHGWDIDLDDGSSNYLLEQNLCLKGGLKLREGFDRVCRNNLTYMNTLHMHVWYENSGDVLEGNILWRPYAPIAMPKTWGEKVDGNILHAPGAESVSHAEELSALSGADASSVRLDIRPENPAGGRFMPRAEVKHGFVQREVYGVAAGRLVSLAERCPVPESEKKEDASGECEFDGVRFKNIDTDGEMSAYATAGHSGALITAVPDDHAWARDGLKDHRAVIALNDEAIEDAQALKEGLASLASGETFTLLLADGRGRRYLIELTM